MQIVLLKEENAINLVLLWGEIVKRVKDVVNYSKT